MHRRLLPLLLAILVIAGCRTAQRDTITQIATIDALLAGAYDGHMRCDALVAHGDVGIGTFDALDGEMIVLDGVVYQVKSDGSIHIADGALTTPFAAVNHFAADRTIDLTSADSLAALTSQLDAAAPNANRQIAIRVHGTFRTLRCRSVPAQTQPYPPLAEVVQHQGIFDYEDITGTLVGYRLPSFIKGVNVPGYHLHFISDDRTRGGHVLGLNLAAGSAELDVCHRLLLILPETDALQHLDLTRDRSDELEKVEK